MNETEKALSLAKYCVNCNHIGTKHAKLNIKRGITQSWSFMPCRQCQEEKKKKICEDFKPKMD